MVSGQCHHTGEWPQRVDLSDNMLTARLASALCRLPSLSVLGLANNNLVSELPTGDLGTLELVDLGKQARLCDPTSRPIELWGAHQSAS
jgi:hypothetical protein